MRKLSKLLFLSPRQWYYLLSAKCVLPLVILSLKARGYKKTCKTLGISLDADSSLPAAIPEQVIKARELAYFIQVSSGYLLFHANCLARSVMLMRFLKKRGIPAQLVFGTKKPSGPAAKLDAHAWVEVNGKPCNDSEDISERYRELLASGRNAS